MNKGEFKKRLSIILTDDNIINKTIDEAKKEFEQILASDMPYFQKLLCLSKFKNDWFGDRE